MAGIRNPWLTASRVLLASLLAGASLPVAVWADDPVVSQTSAEANAPNGDFQMTYTLLHASSAANNITNSGNQAAMDLLQQAQAFYQQALSAYHQGDQDAQQTAIKQAKMTFFRASQLARNSHGETQQETDHRLLKLRRQSLLALLDAHQRVHAEKGANEHAQQVEDSAKATLAQADALIKQGDDHRALALLDKSLNDVKGSLIQLRNGDTLVRSLNFENPADEYAYELERNNSHQMLAKLLLQKKPPDAVMLQRFEQAMVKAGELRQIAEKQASDGDYPTAIKSMENATRQIVNAIRAAGIYIPG